MIKANQNGSSSTFHYGHIINRWADKNEAFLPQTPDPEKPTSIWKLTHKLTNDITKKDEKKINNPRQYPPFVVPIFGTEHTLLHVQW